MFICIYIFLPLLESPQIDGKSIFFESMEWAKEDSKKLWTKTPPLSDIENPICCHSVISSSSTSSRSPPINVCVCVCLCCGGVVGWVCTRECARVRVCVCMCVCVRACF